MNEASWIKYLPAIVVTAIIVIFLSIKTSTVSEQSYKENIELFTSLKNNYTRMGVLILEFRNSSLYNYDELNQVRQNINVDLNNVIVKLYKKNIPNIDSKIDIWYQNTFSYFAYVDRYKFVNSTFHDSYNYLPVLLFRINKEFATNKKKDYVQEIVNNMLGEIHRGVNLGELNAFSTLVDLSQILSKQQKYLQSKNTHYFKELTDHVVRMSASYFELEGIVAEVLDPKWNGFQDSTRETYDQFFQGNLKHVRFYQKILIIFVCILLIYLALIIYGWNELSQFLESVFEHMNEWLLVIKPNGEIKSLNSEASKFLKIDIKTNAKYFINNIVDFFTKESSINKEILSATVPFSFTDAELKLKEEGVKSIPVALSGSPIKTKKNVPKEIVLVAKDLTELRNTENDKLTFLNEMNRSKNTVIVGEMAGRTAHEILNPLTEFNIKLELIHDICESTLKHESLTEEMKEELKESMEYCDDLENGVTLITSKIGEMKKLIRSDSEMGKFDIKTIIQSVYSMVKLQCERNNIIWEEKLKSCIVQANELHLVQVIHGLVENSIQALIESNKFDNAKISFEIIEDIDKISLLVSDNGPGVEQEKINYLFEAGYSGNEKTPGLGLSMGRRLMRLMGGDINVKDAVVGQGITFNLELKKVIEEV